jgi:hypothetical protein
LSQAHVLAMREEPGGKELVYFARYEQSVGLVAADAA